MRLHALSATLLAILTTACAAPPRAATPSADEPPAPAWIAVSPTIRVNRAERAVEFEAIAVIETGFLEEYVCTVGTREHESLFAFDGKASEIHAALLLAGFAPGTPGRWREVQDASGAFAVEAVPPKGDALAITVRMMDGAERALDWFARRAPLGDDPATIPTTIPTTVPAGAADTTTTPQHPPREFVFGGSRFHTDRRTGVERYVADGSGSLIGLVTFGDETVSPVEVVPDQVSAATPIWEVDSRRMPKPGTKVTVTIRRRGDLEAPKP